MVEELKKFSKSTFDLDNIITTASELKYTREIMRLLAEQLQEPSDDFVKYVTSHVYTGRITQPIREQFAQLTKQAFANLINDRITERLKTALASGSAERSTVQQQPGAEATTQAASPEEPVRKVVTTEEETEAFFIVRAILREGIDAKRIAMRDVQSYCGILLDDSNRKPICRLYFNTAQKYLGLFDAGQLERVPIDELDDIYKYADRLKAAVARHENKGTSTSPTS